MADKGELWLGKTAGRGSASNLQGGKSYEQEKDTLYSGLHNIFYSIVHDVQHKSILTRPTLHT